MDRPPFLLAIAMLAAVHLHVGAAAGATTASPADAPKAKVVTTDSRPRVMNSIRAKEPMLGEMKREGMMKEDVHEKARKKDAMMRDAMRKEEMKK